ncbi:MAG: glycoside hydrolase family 130 protein [Planctomycetota bacterium]
MAIQRHPDNPILSAADVPYPCSLLFNAGVCRPAVGKHAGRYVMLFRNDVGARDVEEFLRRPQGIPQFDATNLGLALSDDGAKFEVAPEPVWEWNGLLDGRANEVQRVYDPRLTVIDDVTHVCFAVDTAHGIRGGIATTVDFDRFDILSLSLPDNRNMVLLPERVDGKLCRFERPMPIYGRGAAEAFDLWYSDSVDGKAWGNHRLVLGSNEVPFADGKIGPGAPPILTDAGWLATFHYVVKDENKRLDGWERHGWFKTYGAGLMLTDRAEPWRCIGIAPDPLLAPETDYELKGFRGSVIFPGGMLLEPEGEVKIYYGAADTVECLATAHVDELLALIKPIEL